ncbi:NepR family anti-sigma factor [Qipengyuania sp.]|uniref:NepR family anti-sigma factor n=1 Tax=Qipengyuania sp. TaxID=2004515 RepID=UPI003736E94F
MMDSKSFAGDHGADEGRTSGRRAMRKNPDWTNGLRQLYDAVVDEPLPDQFRDLLAQLDKKG